MADGRDRAGSGETLRIRRRSFVHKGVVVREDIAAAEKSGEIVVDTFEIEVASDLHAVAARDQRQIRNRLIRLRGRVPWTEVIAADGDDAGNHRFGRACVSKTRLVVPHEVEA